MKHLFWLLLLFLCSTLVLGQKLPVILDTDANNELDDQHAIAYLLFNSDLFDIIGITVNGTKSGGDIKNHLMEAQRTVKLCGYEQKMPILKGGQTNFSFIKDHINQPDFEGYEAVNFIIEKSHQQTGGKLILIPIGSFTNIALALHKDPSIAPLVKVVWLGSNWPEPGEYNLYNDTTAVNPLIDNAQLELEILTVRYGEPSGTDAVQTSIVEIQQKMPGLGPTLAEPIEGRSGGQFSNFGDYSVDLFEKMGHPYRALFDVCAIAILKNPDWGKKEVVPAPRLIGESWKPKNQNARKIVFWVDFDKDGILEDFFDTMRDPVLAD